LERERTAPAPQRARRCHGSFASGGGMNPQKEPPMQWHVYETAIQLIQALRPVVAKLATQDPKLSNQIRGAASSVTANLNEGRRRTGKDRMQLWRVAHGSADEIRGHLD